MSNTTSKLLAFLQANCASVQGSQEDFIDDSDPVKRRFRTYLLNIKPAVWGDNGDDTTFHAACEGRAYGLPEEVVLSLMLDIYNPQCVPPWSETEMAKKVSNAFQYSKSPKGMANLRQVQIDKDIDAQGGRPKNKGYTSNDLLIEEEKRQLKWEYIGGDSSKPYTKTLRNCVNYFLLSLRNDLDTNKTIPNEIYRLLKFNEFENKIEFTRPAPWHTPNSKVRFWGESDVVQCRLWMAHNLNFSVDSTTQRDVAMAIAYLYRYHPVRNYLNSLQWDGRKRVDTFLSTYAKTGNNEYIRAIGRCTLVAAVARIMDPGCQHDSMLILEGNEGSGKTSFVRILGGEWFADIKIDPTKMDTAGAMQGAWIIESSEMAFMRNVDVEAMKRFLTLTSDRGRLAYGHYQVDLPRQCIFIGTVNPGQQPVYLNDQEGKRRYWPVLTGNIDLESLKLDRDQLYAEAYEMYKAGVKWHLEGDTIQLAKKEVDSRVGIDPWDAIINDWFHMDMDIEFLTTQKIAYGALNLQPRELDKKTNSRICRCLERLGFYRTNKWDKKVKIYRSVWAENDLSGVW